MDGDFVALYQALEAAKDYYHGFLLEDPAATTARAFLVDRGLGPVAWEDLCLGFSPPQWDHYLKHARRCGTSLGILARAGLIRHPAGGRRFYDHFRARVMFAIADAEGRTIGFAARIVGHGKPLYVSTPKTEIFDESKVLRVMAQIRVAMGDEPATRD